MSKVFLTACSLILALVLVTPLAAQNNVVEMRLDGKTYKVQLNGVLATLCRGQSSQIVSPRNAVFGDAESFPLALVKEGTLAGAVTLIGDGESFPFDIDLKDVRVTDANIRSNGTWTMTLRWSACANRPKEK